MFSCRNSDRLWSCISDAVSQLSASEEPSSKSSKDSGCYMPNEQQQCQRTAKTKNGTGRSQSDGRSQDSRFVWVENGKDIWMCPTVHTPTFYLLDLLEVVQSDWGEGGSVTGLAYKRL